MQIDKEELLNMIEEKYGDLNNDRGCFCNGTWLSIYQIIEIINSFTNE